MREENHTGGEHDEARLSEAAIGQLYRGELGRSDRWRMRLDTTTNWALTTTAARGAHQGSLRTSCCHWLPRPSGERTASSSYSRRCSARATLRPRR